MAEETNIETRPQPKYLLLSYGEYFQLDYDLSIARGWKLGDATERSKGMTPPTAKVNITYDGEGNETGYDLKYALNISSKEQEDYPELFIGFDFKDKSEIVFTGNTEDIPISDEHIETGVVDWTLEHYNEFEIENENLTTYIAGQDPSNYQPIPNEGEWCDMKVYSYGADKAQCLQAHTRMYFTPEETPALWLIIPTVTEGYPEWNQPTGGHDAYQIGDRVSFEGSDYESVIDANVWSPTAYPAGWKQI